MRRRREGGTLLEQRNNRKAGQRAVVAATYGLCWGISELPLDEASAIRCIVALTIGATAMMVTVPDRSARMSVRRLGIGGAGYVIGEVAQAWLPLSVVVGVYIATIGTVARASGIIREKDDTARS